jgi:hypothetical protein
VAENKPQLQSHALSYTGGVSFSNCGLQGRDWPTLRRVFDEKQASTVPTDFRYFKQEPTAFDRVSVDWDTILETACLGGNLEMVEFLL